MKFFILTLGISFILANPCSAQEKESFSGFIYGGQLVSSTENIARSTVALVNNGQVMCSGTVIAEDLVLTAAHCLRSGVLSIRFSPNANNDFSPHREVRDRAIHPLYDSKNEITPGDIALIYFTGGLPKDYRPAILPKPQTQLHDGDTVTAAGFGVNQTRGGRDGAGFLRKTVLEVLQVSISQKLIQVDQSKRTGICFGDSGGPLYDSNEDLGMIVWGVANSVENERCGNYSLYATVTEYLDWIASSSEVLRAKNFLNVSFQ